MGMAMDVTADLAQSITWSRSKQTYYTARLTVDKDLVSDFFRAYAYFRWADDIIDVTSTSDAERASFIRRQRTLIDQLYRNEHPEALSPEEEILRDLIRHDRGKESGLQSFIQNMFAIIEFDAHRKGRLIGQEELNWYSRTLGKSVTDGLQYFIGNGHPYPITSNRYLAAIAAHIAHLLRDMLLDTAEGFINIPREYLEAHNIGPEDIESVPFRDWVRTRVEQARYYFEEGRRYLDKLNVLRCTIAGYWYCARFEGVLNTIERDGYILRQAYNERRRLPTWLKIAWLAVSLPIKSIFLRS
jgi:phytoene/squalene synthetase